jgi:competence protein ComEA
MSFYRNVIAAVAAMTLATCVFADETTTTTSDTTKTTADATAPATTTTETTSEKTTTTTEKVDLNKATAKDLMKVKGISAAKAKAIVTFRKKHGDFKAVEDLKEVKGFKKANEKTMQQIEDQLTVG